MRSNVARDITLRTKQSRKVTTQSISISPTSTGYISQEESVCKSLKRSTCPASTRAKYSDLTFLQDSNDCALSKTTRSDGNCIDLTLNKFQYDGTSYGSDEKKDSSKESIHVNDMKRSRYLSNVCTTRESAVQTDHSQEQCQRQDQQFGHPSTMIYTQSECNTEITESVCTVMWLQGMDAATNGRAMRSGLAHHVNSRTYSTQVC